MFGERVVWISGPDFIEANPGGPVGGGNGELQWTPFQKRRPSLLRRALWWFAALLIVVVVNVATTVLLLWICDRYFPPPPVVMPAAAPASVPATVEIPWAEFDRRTLPPVKATR